MLLQPPTGARRDLVPLDRILFRMIGTPVRHEGLGALRVSFNCGIGHSLVANEANLRAFLKTKRAGRR